MRILVITYTGIPVPPPTYGGIERSVYTLVTGLVQRGHEVTLMAAAGSRVPCRLVPYSDHARRNKAWRAWAKARFFATLMSLARHADIVHSFGRADYLRPILSWKVPKVVNFNTMIPPDWVARLHAAGGHSIRFVSISSSMAREVAHVGQWKTIHESVDLGQYTFRESIPNDAALVYLGLLVRPKGVHTAIRLAKLTGRRLKIAGVLGPTPEDQRYYETEISPHLDGKQIEYVGPVNDSQKNDLLGKAAALLFPIEWDTEAFGRVMIEAMACGTPVIASNRAANPEVVTQGRDGFLCESVEAMATAVGRLGEISRRACREAVEARFSSVRFIEENAALYAEALSSAAMPAGKRR